MPNRLAASSSPYLLQHAHNPVDWFPWGDEAIAEARRRGVPIFLSAGYSTCYWCHVMERESFEDAATARAMNERFVCVKLDREEHPEVDEIYMAAVQMLTGSGGWPMNVFLEPDGLRPFWGGTYYPPTPAFGRPSFTQVLARIGDAWKSDREGVLRQAHAVAAAVREHLAPPENAGAVAVGPEQVSMGVSTLLTIFDRARGGFGSAPKFPQPAYLEFLLAARSAAGDEATRQGIDAALRTTLDAMALGGIFDQVGGGFHRYSVDAFWLVPHFEKMLYDNAQLLGVYAEASSVFGDAFYARGARRTAEYVLREMTAPDGTFFTAQDAEVDGREGLNYVWTPEDLAAALPEATVKANRADGGAGATTALSDAEFASRVYGVADGPNFRDPHHPNEPARSVLRLAERPEAIAKRFDMALDAFLARLDAVNARLLAFRDRRKQPRRDDKVLTAWNGQMIEGLARAGAALGEPRYIAAAKKALAALMPASGAERFVIQRTRGCSPLAGLLEDSAWLARGIIALHRADSSVSLAPARAIVAEARRRFGDPASGGFFEAEEGRGDLFVRSRATYDGAIPSAASVMLHDLIDLAQLTRPGPGPLDLQDATAALLSVSSAIAASPIATVNSTRALLRLLTIGGESLSKTIAAAAKPAGAGAKPRPGFSSDQAVEIFASESSVEVNADHPAELALRLVVAPGHHINAYDAGDDAHGTLVPLRVAIVGGTGVVAHAEYPTGDPLEGATHRVHHGEVDFVVVLERTGEWTGTPRLAVGFQACTATACLEPAMVELGVDISE